MCYLPMKVRERGLMHRVSKYSKWITRSVCCCIEARLQGILIERELTVFSGSGWEWGYEL